MPPLETLTTQDRLVKLAGEKKIDLRAVETEAQMTMQEASALYQRLLSSSETQTPMNVDDLKRYLNFIEVFCGFVYANTE